MKFDAFCKAHKVSKDEKRELFWHLLAVRIRRMVKKFGVL